MTVKPTTLHCGVRRQSAAATVLSGAPGAQKNGDFRPRKSRAEATALQPHIGAMNPLRLGFRISDFQRRFMENFDGLGKLPFGFFASPDRDFTTIARSFNCGAGGRKAQVPEGRPEIQPSRQ
jgi:hypothetical protein